MQGAHETAWLIGTAYVAGLALLGVIMLLRGRNEVDGAAFPSLLGAIAQGKGFTPDR